LVLTHDDNDHAGGKASVLQGISVDRLASSLPACHPLLKNMMRSFPCFASQAWT